MINEKNVLEMLKDDIRSKIVGNVKDTVYASDVEELKKLKPHYIEFKGWGNIDNINKNNIPKELKDYIDYIEKETREKIAYIGIGRKDKDLIKL